VDLACGHGLLAHLLLVLDDTSPSAVAADVRIPESAHKVASAMIRTWPRLAGRVDVRTCALADVEVGPGDLLVSVHACGALTDDVLRCAVAARTRVAVLPCCQDAKVGDLGSFGGWFDAPLAIDVERVTRLRLHGYTVRTERIPEAITEKNRLFLAEPSL